VNEANRGQRVRTNRQEGQGRAAALRPFWHMDLGPGACPVPGFVPHGYRLTWATFPVAGLAPAPAPVNSMTWLFQNAQGQLAAPLPSCPAVCFADPMLAKAVAATGGHAAAQVKSTAGCSMNDRESPRLTLLTGTWRA